VTNDELILQLLPFIVLVALTAGFVVIFRQRAEARRASERRVLVEPGLVTARGARPPAGRPWWATPWVWIGASIISVLLGVFVWPGLFAGTVIFIPFVWVSRSKPPPVDPRSNGHGS
jgi:hypothetical protein